MNPFIFQPLMSVFPNLALSDQKTVHDFAPYQELKGSKNIDCLWTGDQAGNKSLILGSGDKR